MASVMLHKAQSYYQSNFTLGCAVVCGAVATEMALRAIVSLIRYNDVPQNSLQHKAQLSEKIGGNLGGAIALGLCATNIVPGTARIAASFFVPYSWYYANDPNEYLTSKLFHKPLKWAFDWVLEPAWDHVIAPVSSRIWAAVSYVFALIPLPKHPIWYAVGALSVAVVITLGIRNGWPVVSKIPSLFHKSTVHA
jgi:hypothetical protein